MRDNKLYILYTLCAFRQSETQMREYERVADAKGEASYSSEGIVFQRYTTIYSRVWLNQHTREVSQ